ncbi:MAG: hypothetical protein J6J59_04090, partial [Peptococcaceae bacterium]|nr:hypothetical protein [Peptococcaceae bacterium]
MSYILFSPIGKTDPITTYHDGSMLHICRKYKPEKVYLYISQEMLKFHYQDNRYCQCLEWLQEKEGFACEIYIIERPDLVDVQIFDTFYDDFETEVLKIQEDNPEATILFNVSSGTPAMKSALQFLAASSENEYIPVQVSTPQKGANREKYEFEDYPVDINWEMNEDNIEPFIDRCIESPTRTLNKRIKLEVIRKHIEAYDYQAAWRVAQTISDLLPEETLALLEGAAKRFNLVCNEAEIAFRKAGVNILPAISSDKRFVVEYLLWLQIKQKRGDLVDFLRGVTPVIVHLFALTLKEKAKIDFYDYCEKNKKGVWYPRIAKFESKNKELYEHLQNNLPNGGISEKTPLNSTILHEALNLQIKDMPLLEKAKELRKLETDARNIVAHEIVPVTDDWLQQGVGMSSYQIMKLLKEFTQQGCTGIKADVWNSYDEMNKVIIAQLK